MKVFRVPFFFLYIPESVYFFGWIFVLFSPFNWLRLIKCFWFEYHRICSMEHVVVFQVFKRIFCCCCFASMRGFMLFSRCLFQKNSIPVFVQLNPFIDDCKIDTTIINEWKYSVLLPRINGMILNKIEIKVEKKKKWKIWDKRVWHIKMNVEFHRNSSRNFMV